MATAPLSRVQRILVVRTDHIGDLVLSTGFLKSLRKAAPQAHIVARVAAYTRPVLKPGYLVDEVITEGVAQDCELAISLAPRSQSLRLVHRSRAPWRVGYYYAGRPLVELSSRFWLTHRSKVRIEPGAQVPHEIDQLQVLADLLEIDYSDRDPDLGLAAPAVGSELVLHLGNRWFTGDWSVEDMAELARALGSHGPVVVTFGPREHQQALEMQRRFPEVSLAGGLSFEQWALRLGSARCVVSCDTGAVHLAAAFARPVVVAYEPATFNLCSQQWAPWKTANRQLLKAEPEKTVGRLSEAVEELLRS